MFTSHLDEISRGLSPRYQSYRRRTPGRGRQRFPPNLRWLFW